MTGAYVAQFGVKGTGNGQLSEPSGIAVAPSGAPADSRRSISAAP